eukprot:gene12403-12491_t
MVGRVFEQGGLLGPAMGVGQRAAIGEAAAADMDEVAIRPRV